MEAAIVQAVIALIGALIEVAPTAAKVFSGGRTVEELEADATAALAKDRKVSAEWDADLDARKERG